MLKQPRGALGIHSRKKRPKQATIKMRVGPDDNLVEKEIPFTPGMPPFLITFLSEEPPGILTGASRDKEWGGRVFLAMPSDFNEMGKASIGMGEFRFGFHFHAGVFSQMIAKTAHAYAVAELGIDAFTPSLAEYCIAKEPAFDSYHIAAMFDPRPSDALHEISLGTAFARTTNVLGISTHPVYAVQFRIFAQLSAPTFIVVVGRPTMNP